MANFLSKLTPKEILRTCRNALMDLRYGGFSGGYVRNPNPGAHGTGATDYAILSQLFESRIRPDDVLVDVGCGKGRVINWWLNQGLQNRIYGLEQLPAVGQSTFQRLRRFKNVTIIVGDAVDNLPDDGTVFYLFNPFDEQTVERFANRLRNRAERKCITVIYFAPVHINIFRSASCWRVEEVGVRLPSSGRFEARHTTFCIITLEK